MTPGESGIEQLKAGMRRTWMAGDFGRIALHSSESGGEFVERLNIAPNLLDQARARAAAEGLRVSFEEGDAEQLPYPDARFDVAMTMFGAMFAPRPEIVAADLARVCRPAGTTARANWTPDGFVGKMFALGSRYVPALDYPFPPAGVVQLFREYFGPAVVAFSRLDAAGQQAYAADLEELWRAGNEAGGGHTLVHAEYLEVTATRD